MRQECREAEAVEIGEAEDEASVKESFKESDKKPRETLNQRAI